MSGHADAPEATAAGLVIVETRAGVRPSTYGAPFYRWACRGCGDTGRWTRQPDTAEEGQRRHSGACASLSANLPTAEVLRTAIQEIDRLLTRASATWQACFTSHGDPYLAPPDRPWRTSRIAEVSTSAPDYGRANCLLLGAAGPDHWRAVRDLFQEALGRNRLVAAALSEDEDAYAASSHFLALLRPLAEQVLQHLAVRP